MNLHLRTGLLVILLVVGCGSVTRAETPEEWVKLGARVHGGFGSFIPVGIRIGEDAMKRLNAQPRELSVVYYSGEGVPWQADDALLRTTPHRKSRFRHATMPVAAAKCVAQSLHSGRPDAEQPSLRGRAR